MKALIVGLGSIGTRHLRILTELLDVQIFGIRRTQTTTESFPEDRTNFRFFDSLKEAVDAKPDFAVVSNPTCLHVETALILAEAGIPFLIEKPISDRLSGMEDLLRLVTARHVPTMVGFQLRFHPNYVKMIEIINSGLIGRLLHMHGYVGQYLPEWRPERDYRSCYSARRVQGGGVILDLCHEIDLALSILGRVDSISCMAGRFSDLEIDTEDMADIVMRHHERKLSMIHLNYLERSYVWQTRVVGENGSIIWDYAQGYLELHLSDGTRERWENPPGFERDDIFRDQMRCWLDVLEGKAIPKVDLDQGIYVTKVALAAKTSAAEMRHITL